MFESGINSGELASLCFLRKGGNSDLLAVENIELEVYVYINIGEDGLARGYEVLTFDEIKETLK